MLYLTLQHITKSYGPQLVLDIDRFQIHEGQRIGLIGQSGAGKTTLVRLIMGDILPDTGRVERRCPIAYIAQNGDGQGGDPAVLKTLGVSHLQRQETVSGGERTRRAIAQALSEQAPLLVADEPTTHLDMQGCALIEQQLTHYAGSVLLVSHDRQLLDAVCTHIVELEDGRLTVFAGNYSDYLAHKSRLRDSQEAAYAQYREEQARLRRSALAAAERSRKVRKAPSRMGLSEARLHRMEGRQTAGVLSRQAKALQTRLERLPAQERPRDLPDIRMLLTPSSPIVSQTALSAQGLDLFAGTKRLLTDAHFTLPAGSHTALVGPNGAGKTTLLRAIAQGREEINRAQGLRLGILSQHQGLQPDATVLEAARSWGDRSQTDARLILAALEIKGDAVHKPCGVLSGGERVRVALARLMLSDCNCLLLDEPSNALDLYALEALEEVLATYAGTLLLISHDRRLIDRTADRLLVIEKGRLVLFDGPWSAYEASRRKPKSQAGQDLAQTALRMRMAAISGQLNGSLRQEEADRLEQEYLDLAAQLRTLEGGRGAQ